MRWILFALGLLVLVSAIGVSQVTTSAMHEIFVTLLFILAAMLISVAGILEELVRHRKLLKKIAGVEKIKTN